MLQRERKGQVLEDHLAEAHEEAAPQRVEEVGPCVEVNQCVAGSVER